MIEVGPMNATTTTDGGKMTYDREEDGDLIIMSAI